MTPDFSAVKRGAVYNRAEFPVQRLNQNFGRLSTS